MEPQDARWQIIRGSSAKQRYKWLMVSLDGDGCSQDEVTEPVTSTAKSSFLICEYRASAGVRKRDWYETGRQDRLVVVVGALRQDQMMRHQWTPRLDSQVCKVQAQGVSR